MYRYGQTAAASRAAPHFSAHCAVRAHRVVAPHAERERETNDRDARPRECAYITVSPGRCAGAARMEINRLDGIYHRQRLGASLAVYAGSLDRILERTHSNTIGRKTHSHTRDAVQTCSNYNYIPQHCGGSLCLSVLCSKFAIVCTRAFCLEQTSAIFYLVAIYLTSCPAAHERHDDALHLYAERAPLHFVCVRPRLHLHLITGASARVRIESNDVNVRAASA